MAILRVECKDVATGKEVTLQPGDTIENLVLAGLAMIFRGGIDGAGSPFPLHATLANGDLYTIIAGAPITDPEAPGQTFEPGDEIVWDAGNLWWVCIANADIGNIQAALITLLTVEEDLLMRRGGVLARLGKGADGEVLGVAAGLLTYITPSAAEPKAPLVWRIDVVNGNDGTGDGSFDTPLATLQRAIVLAHLSDIVAAAVQTHIFSFAPGTYAAPAGVTTYFGSNDGADNWSLDTPTYMRASLIGDGNLEPARLGYSAGIGGPNGAVIHGPIANLPAGGTMTQASEIQISNMTLYGDGSGRPALVTFGKCLLDCAYLSFAGSGVGALWMGYWDAHGPIGALTGEQVAFTMKDTTVYSRDDVPAIRAEMVGAFESYRSEVVGETGVEIAGCCLNLDGNNSTTVVLDDVTFTGGYCDPTVNLIDVTSAKILDCDVIGARDATTKSLLIVDPTDWCSLDGNHFGCQNVGLDLTPGNNAVYVVTDDLPNVYWGTNTDGERGSGIPMKEAFHSPTTVTGYEYWFYTKRIVNRQVWDMVTAAPNVAYLTPKFAVAGGASVPFRVVGNGGGGGGVTREALPVEVTEIIGPNSMIETTRVPPLGGPAPGAVAVEWIDFDNAIPEAYTGIIVYNESGGATDYRIVIPGAMLVVDGAPVP